MSKPSGCGRQCAGWVAQECLGRSQGLSEGGNVALGPVGEGAGRTAEDLLDVGADALFGGGGLAEDGRQRRLGDSRYDRPGAREVRGIQLRPGDRDPA